MVNLPQFVPENAGRQVQLYDEPTILHVPPFWQGESEHGVTVKTNQTCNIKLID